MSQKKFTEAELENGRLWVEFDTQTITKRLWWQERGLMFTRTGYGRKVPTSHMIIFENRLRRIYCTIFSNNGTCWFQYKGKQIIVA